MTYEDIVERVREDYENADARAIFEHVAVQINVRGEGAGIFYIEVAARKICVEPYDYFDKDALIEITSDALFGISSGTMSVQEATSQGKLKLSGNMEKLGLLKKIVFKKKSVWIDDKE